MKKQKKKLKIYDSDNDFFEKVKVEKDHSDIKQVVSKLKKKKNGHKEIHRMMTHSIEKDKKLLKKKKTSIYGLKPKQMLMIGYLAAGMTMEEIHLRLGVSIKRMNFWLNKKAVKKYLDSVIQHHDNLDAKRRRQRNEFVTTRIYDALVEKIQNGSFERMSSKNLLKMLIDMNKEVRNDSPIENLGNKAGGSSRIDINVQIGQELAQRYQTANSSSYEDRKEKYVQMALPAPQTEQVIDVGEQEQSEKVEQKS